MNTAVVDETQIPVIGRGLLMAKVLLSRIGARGHPGLRCIIFAYR